MSLGDSVQSLLYTSEHILPKARGRRYQFCPLAAFPGQTQKPALQIVSYPPLLQNRMGGVPERKQIQGLYRS